MMEKYSEYANNDNGSNVVNNGSNGIVPLPTEIGREFVRQYYTKWSVKSSEVFQFYGNESTFHHDDIAAKGQKSIQQAIEKLNYVNCRAKIHSITAEIGANDGLAILVCGELAVNQDEPRRFFQSFLLCKVGPKNYGIQHDIFKWLDKAFLDSSAASDVTTVNNKVKEPIIHDNQVDNQQHHVIDHCPINVLEKSNTDVDKISGNENLGYLENNFDKSSINGPTKTFDHHHDNLTSKEEELIQQNHPSLNSSQQQPPPHQLKQMDDAKSWASAVSKNASGYGNTVNNYSQQAVPNDYEDSKTNNIGGEFNDYSSNNKFPNYRNRENNKRSFEPNGGGFRSGGYQNRNNGNFQNRTNRLPGNGAQRYNQNYPNNGGHGSGGGFGNKFGGHGSSQSGGQPRFYQQSNNNNVAGGGSGARY